MKSLKYLLYSLSILFSYTSCSVDNAIPVDISSFSNQADSISTLVIKIKNIPSVEGRIFLAIFNNKLDFDSKSNPVFSGIQYVNNDSIFIIVDSLQSGDYAISTYHDLNANGILDANAFGIPTESFGFSNNALGTFGPPSFDQSKFNCDGKKDLYQEIILVHF